MDAKKWISDHFLPRVVVIASPAAEALCQSKNGLTLVDLLRPFGRVRNINFPMKFGEYGTRVQDITIQFHELAHAFQPKLEVIDEHLKQTLLQASLQHAKLEPEPDIVQKIRAGSTTDFTPWFTIYKREFYRVLSFNEHESTDHPVACIYIVPSDVPDPLSHFEALRQQAPSPPLMKQDIMVPLKDPALPKHFVLLHDMSAGTSEKRAQDNMHIIVKAYGEASCSLLRINSGNGDKLGGAGPEIFHQCRAACLPGGGAGEPFM